ncbi:MAG: 2,3-bisphosphoglycerate-independent phosphoglycerate mutase [Elusimicrobiota bacterium]|nr:2,3-bisphosphoglycerate-independent phosphoglycerate mutase [Elusimicrobiota bacterium]
MSDKKRVLLIIRDGWGIAKPDKFNAIFNAEKKNISAFLEKYPNTVLDPAGEAVGLPKGYQGSSEVGHLNMGAGRIVEQELKKIMDMIEDGSLFQSTALKNAVENAVRNNSALHLMGLIQDEGVHAHQDHLFALLKHAKEKGVKTAYIHFFADGRDTPPRSSLTFIKKLSDEIKEIGLGSIATVTGRYYAMDRSEKWELTDKTYNAIVNVEGKKSASAEEAVRTAYDSLKTPDGDPMVDEYLPPTVIADYSGMQDGDCAVHINFRQDRAIQLAKAFVEKDYKGARSKKLNITFCGLTRYYDTFEFNALPPMDESDDMNNLLGQAISEANLTQLRLAETQKFKHVTSFFNGKMLKPYKGEDRIEIKGSFDPSSFALHPQMNAPEVTESALKEIPSLKYDFIVINFANCDMVGHTGNYDSVLKAVDIVDDSVGEVTKEALKNGYTVMITADHGNAEEMWDYKTDMPKTCHTNNLVEFIFINNGAKKIELRKQGILSDIAPTVLDVLGIEKPKDMSSQSLIATESQVSSHQSQETENTL